MKLAKYYIPDISLSQSIELVKIIFNDKISSDEALATKLNHKTTNSGGFIMKLVTLRQLGLIQSGIKGIKLTKLGEKIARPVGEEIKQAYNEMVSHVPILAELKKKFHSKTPDKDGMLLALIDLTSLDRSKLDVEVPKIQKLYIDALKYMPSTLEVVSDVGGEMMIPNAEGEFTEIKIKDLYLRIPRDLESINRAEKMLHAERELLEEERKSKKK